MSGSVESLLTPSQFLAALELLLLLRELPVPPPRLFSNSRKKCVSRHQNTHKLLIQIFMCIILFYFSPSLV
jgi:hypothetical protein